MRRRDSIERKGSMGRGRLWTYLLTLLTLSTLFLSSPVLAAISYYCIITVTSSGAPSYGELGVGAAENNTYLVAQHYITANGTDVQVLRNGTSLPRMLADNATYFATPVTASSITNFNMTTGNTPSDFAIIPGFGGYVTSNDTASDEISGNGTLEVCAHFPTSNTTDVAIKSSAMSLSTGSGNITANMFSISSTTVTIVPNGAGYTTAIASLFGAPTHWQAVITNDTGTSYVYTGSTIEEDDFYTMGVPTFLGLGAPTITSVVFHTVADQGGGVNAYTKLYASLSGTNTASGAITVASQWLDKTWDATAARPGGGSWTAADFAAGVLQAGIGAWCDGGGTGGSTYVYVVITYSYATVNKSATFAEADGLYNVLASVNATASQLQLWIDGTNVASTALGGATVPDTATNWVFNAPYFNYIKITNSGVEKIWYQPVTIISGTTLPDRDSTKDGIITWGSNPSNISVSVGALNYNSAAASANPAGVTPNVVPPLPSTGPAGSNPVNQNSPLYFLFHIAAVMLNVPDIIMVNIAFIFLMTAAGIACLASRLGPVFTGIIEIFIYGVSLSLSVTDWWMIFMVVTFIMVSWMLPRQTAVL